MKIVVVSTILAGEQVANAINTVNMANAFVKLGHSVTLICYRNPAERWHVDELVEIYKCEASLKWIRLPPLQSRRFQLLAQWIFALLAFLYILRLRPNLAFARNYIVPWLTARAGIPTIAESHAHVGSTSRMFRTLMNATNFPAFRALITISPVLAEYYQQMGAIPEKLIILPTGVDLQRFWRPNALPPSPYTAGKNIVYSGHHYDYKGIPTILECAKHLPDYAFHFVGGYDKDVRAQAERARQLGIENVHFHGRQRQSQLPPFLWHADLLLLPPSAKHPSAAWTSPVKLGEYLASGNLVIASAIPALRYWLDDEVIFFEPDNAHALADAIQQSENLAPPEKDKIIARAYLKAKSFDNLHRAQRLLDAL